MQNVSRRSLRRWSIAALLAAGAFADPGSVARGRAAGRDAAADLAANDAYAFFSAEGGLLRTGPTLTNALDLVLVAIEP